MKKECIEMLSLFLVSCFKLKFKSKCYCLVTKNHILFYLPRYHAANQ